ncbi:hypothetical protein ANCDUO_16088 [Ancylostoma duodenale]|uniref:Uncharacterized protein n=1 Tax=Ancylostoma duodenale TaxID=51022 RepID=A0A0C2CV95_9BILA|nr:hypothetical protein ANCDUO_16088 [Ancylostoma duodenale]
MPALTIFVACAPTPSYDEDEIGVVCTDLEKSPSKDNTLSCTRSSLASAKSEIDSFNISTTVPGKPRAPKTTEKLSLRKHLS